MNSPRFYMAQEEAYKVLLKYSDGKLPIDPFKIIKKIKNIKLMTYTEFAIKLQEKDPSLSIKEIRESFKSDRGFLTKKGNKKYILAYNDEDPLFVIWWTLFHELGHYFLKHLVKKNKTLYYNEVQKKSPIEKEADCFARHCSSPFPIIKIVAEETNFTNDEDLSFLFYYMYQMGNKVIKRCTEHFRKYSHYYGKEKYEGLVTKFTKSILKTEIFIYNHFIFID